MYGWLLTNTTYGTWLPGDPRGSVTSVRDQRACDTPHSHRFEHDLFGEPWEDSLPGLYRSAAERMSGPPILLSAAQAATILNQFQETAEIRGWILHAVAIMQNHFHLIVQHTGDERAQKLLSDLKAYASRALNREYGRPISKTWWTTNGSKRLLKTDDYWHNACNYVLYKQEFPLVVWSRELGRIV